MGNFKPVYLGTPKCEVCGRFMKDYEIHTYPSDVLALEPNEPSCLCKKCYNEEVRGQDQCLR